MGKTQIRGQAILDKTLSIDDFRDLSVEDGGGLTVNYEAGNIRDDNTVVAVASGSVAVTDNTTNFIEVDNTGSVSSNTVGFTSGRIPLAQVVTLSGSVTDVQDKRAWLSIPGAGGGGGGDLNEADFVEGETPSGDLDGVDTTYTLAFTPTPSTSLKLYINGIRQNVGAGNDYTLSGNTITLSIAPVSTDVILADYRK